MCSTPCLLYHSVHPSTWPWLSQWRDTSQSADLISTASYHRYLWWRISFELIIKEFYSDKDYFEDIICKSLTLSRLCPMPRDCWSMLCLWLFCLSLSTFPSSWRSQSERPMEPMLWIQARPGRIQPSYSGALSLWSGTPLSPPEFCHSWLWHSWISRYFWEYANKEKSSETVRIISRGAVSPI